MTIAKNQAKNSSPTAASRSSREGDSSNTTGTGTDAGSSAEGGHVKANPGNSTGGNSGKTTTKPTEMRFLQHDGPLASQLQSFLRGKTPNLSEKDKGIIGGVVGASTGALALGLLAGLVHPTSPQPFRARGQVQPSTTLAAVGVNSARTKSHVSDTVVFAAGAANITNGTKHEHKEEHKEEEEEEEEESPVKQWWGWAFLIPLFLMAALCCFAIFLFKGNVAGTWSKRKRSRAYSRLSVSEPAVDTSEGMLSGDPLSPPSAEHMPSGNQQVYNSPTPAPRGFSVATAPSQNAQLTNLSPVPVPMAQPGGWVMVRTFLYRLTSQQLQQQPQQQQHQGGQRQMSLATSQQHSRVQGQQNPPSRQAGGSNSLFDSLDQNHDGVITRDEFNRAFDAEMPVLVGSAPRPPVSTVIAPHPRALPTTSMMLATPGALPTTAVVASPVRHPNPSWVRS